MANPHIVGKLAGGGGGEEEAGGASVEQWVRADERGADCAIVFDSGMEDVHTPAITLGLRGVIAAPSRVASSFTPCG